MSSPDPYAVRHWRQVDHIAEHRRAFEDHVGDAGTPENISQYLIDYAGKRHDIYQRLCYDLGITPQDDICHPDPYGER